MCIYPIPTAIVLHIIIKLNGRKIYIAVTAKKSYMNECV